MFTAFCEKKKNAKTEWGRQAVLLVTAWLCVLPYEEASVPKKSEKKRPRRRTCIDSKTHIFRMKKRFEG